MRIEWNGRLARRTAVALAAAAAAIVTAQAPASAEPPVPADRPTFTAFLPNHTIAVGSAVKVATVWLSSNLVVDPVLTLDAGGLAPVATVEFPDFCTVNGSNATCPIDEDVRSVPLRLTPVPGVAPGTSGRISYQASASNIEPYGPVTALITAGTGTDLVNLLDTEIDEPAQPGERFSVPVPFYNAGDEEADGFDLIGVFTSGFRPDIPAGCQTRTDDSVHKTIVRCTVDGTVPPGDDASATVTTLTAQLTPDALFWEGVNVSVWPLGTGPELGELETARGTRPALTTRKADVGTLAQTPDIDESDNAGAFFLTNVENAFDVAATGGSASGAVGQTVQVSFGLVNRAVGSVDSRFDGVFPGIAFSVPDGTEAVGVDGFCGIPVYAPDGTIFDVQTGKPGGRFYLCGASGFLARGDTDRFTFQLRIEQATTTAGHVSLSDNTRQYPAWVGDDVSGNDDARVTVTVVAGGGEGGDGGSLPITGVATGALAAAGGALLLAGLALVLLSRRRRVTVHSE